MSEIIFKEKPAPIIGCVIDHTLNPKETFTPFGECEHPDTAASRILPGSTRIRCDFKIMTKEMYENFVKQGKKFVTLIGGHECDSLEETGIDLDGDIVIVDGQKYAVNVESWYLRGK